MKIFWDTNLFIYLWEKKAYAEEIDRLCAFISTHSYSTTTSSLTIAEILVKPQQLKRVDLIDQYLRAFAALEVIPFGCKESLLFAKLRAINPALRPPDAIQLACACSAKCSVFLTNDERLAKVKHPSSLSVSSLQRFLRDVKG